jgi:replication-associated recombination protein RarA
MSITIVKNDKPDLKMPKFNVDGILHKQLNDYPLTSLLNKSNFSVFLGKSGQGKSSLAISLLKSKGLFKGVYHNIFLFCPPNSRASVKNDFWGQNLPEEAIYDELNVDNLMEVYDIAQQDASDGFKSLIILDDVQKYLKDPEIQKFLLHIVNNRRHALTSVWILAQNYFQISKRVREALTNAFIFKVSKIEFINIFSELIEKDKSVFQEIIEKYAYKEPHSFVFLDTTSGRMFSNWDEIVIKE